ncbi:MAG: hypothetical protein PHV74_12735 [Dehalococcoidia bacterium]|nr:hypothetical protein [Dehalococcoidia bacterium]
MQERQEFQHLTEVEQRELDQLAQKNDQASLDRFIELMGKEAVDPDGCPWSQRELRESFRRLCPDWTDKQLDIAVNGR